MKDVIDYAQMDSPVAPNYDALAAEASVVILRRGYCYEDRNGWFQSAHDPVYQRDAAELARRGVTVWEYCFPCFNRGAPSPTQQVASHFAVGGPPAGLTFLDIEFPGRGIVDTGQSAQAVGRLIVEFIDAFAARGVKVAIYSSHVQMSDDNALNGALENEPKLKDLIYWAKVPYPVGAGKPRSDAYRKPHDDGSDYWSVPFPFQSYWLCQVQGDERDFHGVKQADRSYFRPAKLGDSGPQVAWVRSKLKLSAGQDFDADVDAAVRALQSSKGLDVDGIIGPKTLECLNAL